MDRSGSGMIDANEFRSFLKSQNKATTEEEVEVLLNSLDYHGNGKIDWASFLATTIDMSKVLTEKRLQAIFH